MRPLLVERPEKTYATTSQALLIGTDAASDSQTGPQPDGGEVFNYWEFRQGGSEITCFWRPPLSAISILPLRLARGWQELSPYPALWPHEEGHVSERHAWNLWTVAVFPGFPHALYFVFCLYASG